MRNINIRIKVNKLINFDMYNFYRLKNKGNKFNILNQSVYKLVIIYSNIKI